MSVRLAGSTSGYTELDAGAIAGNNTLKMPVSNGAAYQIIRNGATAGTTEFADKIVSGTAVASTSGTSIDFTGIPGWVKRVTVMFAGVSTNGSSVLQVQIGDGAISSSGYNSTALYAASNSVSHDTGTSGFRLYTYGTSDVKSGLVQLVTLGSNIWLASGWCKISTTQSTSCMGDKTLTGTLDRIRITTVNGTDQFDAGTINILME